MKSLLLLSTVILAPVAHAECIAPREFINFSHNGQYHRVHPSGNYVLYSNGGVSIADISDRSNVKTIQTRMRQETYPVESATGGWDLLASPYDSDGMNYYQMKDILAKQAQATSVYKDKENDQYYHSSAELPGSTADVKKVRTLLYGRTYREYEMRKDAQGNFTEVTAGPARQQMCTTFRDSASNTPTLDRSVSAADTAKLNEATAKLAESRNQMNTLETKQSRLENQIYDLGRKNKGKKKKLQAELNSINAQIQKLYEVRRPYAQLVEDLRYGSAFFAMATRYREIEKRYYEAPSSERQALRTEMTTLQANINRYYEGSNSGFSNPVMSKDGTLVAAASSNNVIVYKILPEGVCEKVAETGYSTAKVSFSYPEPGKLPKMTFVADSGPSGGNGSGVYQIDLETKRSTYLGVSGEYARYPGFTKDGRVIYAGGPSSGFTIVDPNQVGGTDPSTCIQKAAAGSSSGTSGTSNSGSAE